MSNTPPPPGGYEPQQPGYGQQQPQPQTIIVQQEKKSRKGCWIALALVLVIGLGGCIASLALVGEVAESVDESLQESQNERDAQKDAVEDAVDITMCGVSDTTGWGEVTIEFTSPLDEEKGFINIEINFFDADDAVVGSGTVNFENIEPGQKAIGEGIAVDLVEGASVARCEVVDSTVL